VLLDKLIDAEFVSNAPISCPTLAAGDIIQTQLEEQQQQQQQQQQTEEQLKLIAECCR